MTGRLLRLAFTATVVAGLVGVLRHRHEAALVRAGELPPSWTVVDAPPRRRYGPVASRLATWIPAPPRGRLAQVLAGLWAAPLTVAGFALALASGRLPRWEPALGCFVARRVRGPSRIALRAVGAHANAVGHVVLARGEDPPASLLAHEVVHVRQAERLGPLLVPLYAWLGALHGYQDHPLERAARRAADAVRAGATAGT